MTLMFITADIGGIHQLSHKLPILPIYEILKQQGYDVIWGKWQPWGVPFEETDKNKAIQYYVTGDVGIPGDNTGPVTKTFFHTHGLHRMEMGYVSKVTRGYLAPGELWYSITDENAKFREVKHGVGDLSKIPVTGWAKLDTLFKTTKEQTIVDYGLNLPYDKTVLYAPAGNWDYATSFNISIEHILNLFSRLPYNLIIKNGLYSESFEKWGWYRDVAVPPNINKILGAPLGSANIDITPLYNVADIMITDGSSVAWEFIGTDNPVIQLNNMIDPSSSLMTGPCGAYCNVENQKGYRYKNEYGKSIIVNDHPECRACGGCVKTGLENLEQEIIDAIEYPNRYQEERRKWAKLYNKYVDGKCAQRCVDAIKRLGEI